MAPSEKWTCWGLPKKIARTVWHPPPYWTVGDADLLQKKAGATTCIARGQLKWRGRCNKTYTFACEILELFFLKNSSMAFSVDHFLQVSVFLRQTRATWTNTMKSHSRKYTARAPHVPCIFMRIVPWQQAQLKQVWEGSGFITNSTKSVQNLTSSLTGTCVAPCLRQCK